MYLQVRLEMLTKTMVLLWLLLLLLCLDGHSTHTQRSELPTTLANVFQPGNGQLNRVPEIPVMPGETQFDH
jgi:hypothetical protein